MTLDQSLANLQYQADRLANLFASTADAIEAGTAKPASAARVVADSLPTRGDHWDHTHEGAEIVYHGEGRAVEPTAAEAAVLANPHVSNAIEQTFAGTAETVKREWRGEVADDIAPEPVHPTDAQLREREEGITTVATQAQTPWDAQAAAAPAAEQKPAKKGGRRTHEQLAADAGVSLDAVKKWLGGQKVTKAGIEEFAATHPEAVHGAAPAQVTPNPFGGAAVPAPRQPYDNGGALPAGPTPVQPIPTATPPQAQGAPQEWPALAQPVTPPAAEQYGDWPVAEGGFNPSNPFGG